MVPEVKVNDKRVFKIFPRYSYTQTKREDVMIIDQVIGNPALHRSRRWFVVVSSPKGPGEFGGGGVAVFTSNSRDPDVVEVLLGKLCFCPYRSAQRIQVQPKKAGRGLLPFPVFPADIEAESEILSKIVGKAQVCLPGNVPESDRHI